MTFENIIDMQVGSTKVESAWFNEEQVWPTGEVWYGVKFVGSTTTGERTGNLEYHKTLPLQSQMRGCTLTSDGTAKYLNPTDWTKYEDGTAVDSSLNVMVYVPDYYIKFIHNEEEDSDEIRIASKQFDDAVLITGGYCSAYEAYNDGGTLKSIKGVNPSVNITRANFEAYAQVNGTNWHGYTYAMHKAITWLFVVEHACRNSQASVNNVLTAEGYHQGGLGNGVTTGIITVDGANVYNFVPCGTSDSLGNNTGEVEYTTTTADETQRTVNVPRYRGIENLFGHVWKNTVDTVITNVTGSDTTNQVYLTDNPEHFAETTKDNFTLTDILMTSTQNYVKQLSNNTAGDLFPIVASSEASTNKYYCDYHWDNTNASARTALISGLTSNGGLSGLFALFCYDGVGTAHARIGCRLIYLK